MVLGYFDQFLSPSNFGVPLFVIALCLPWVVLPFPGGRWLGSRLLVLQGWSLSSFARQMVGPLKPGGHKWTAVLVSLMVFLLTLNILGLAPYTFTPTTQLSLNLGLAVPLWGATVIIGMRNNSTAAIGHLLPEGTPAPLIPMLVVIETISLLIRPLALGVRLTANLTAGHLLIGLISSAVVALASSMPLVSLVSGLVGALLMLLEVAVGMIQAYVFVLLLSLYLEENL